MPFVLSRATTEDAPALGAIQLLAFAPSPLTAHLFPTLFTGDWEPIYEFTYKRIEQDMTNPHMHFIKVTDTDTQDNKIVAFAKWEGPHETEEKTDGQEEKQLKLPKGANPEVFHEFFGTIARKKVEIMGNRGPFWYLHILVVLPEYQRNGLGKLLSVWGLGQADRDGLEVYIEASRYGYSLYKSLGWEDVDTIYMLDGTHKTVCMLRPAMSAANAVAAVNAQEA